MWILAAILFWIAAGAVQGQELLDQRPILRIEPGMHTAPLLRIGVDAACNLMVTGSVDKTARLWALPEGERGAPELLRTLRVPIGEGNDGKVYAVALSPNGKWVAVGGWDVGYVGVRRGTNSVYIFDGISGRLIKRLGRLGSVVLHLAFSPDGSRLAATLGGGEDPPLWETGSWRLIPQDRDYGGKDSYGATFDGANRLFTVAFDGQIRRYGADGHLEAKASTQGGKQPFSIAMHPKDAKFAIGFNDSTAVEVYDARTLARLYAADTSSIREGSFNGVAWSADGARLYAGGGGYKVAGKNPAVIWQDEGRGQRSEVPLSHNTLAQLLPCSEGIAWGAQDPAFGLIAANGEKQVWQDRVTADMRDKLREAFTLSFDAKRVRFGLGQGGDAAVLFDLASFSLSDAQLPVPGLDAPKTSGLAVTDWEKNVTPKLNGKPIALKNYEISFSLAIAPDASRFVLGTDYLLSAYPADGSKLWQKQIPGIAWGVNISGDGRLVAAAYADGTIRWHRMSDGKELIALFVHAKDGRFIAWTPKGYYAASPGAEDLIGWHVNRDRDHAADFFSVSRFRDQYNRPDIVKRILDDLDEDKAIAEANRLAGTKPAEEVKKILPPVITILSPTEGNTFSGRQLTVSYSVRSPSGLPLKNVRALIDGRPVRAGDVQMKGFVPESEQSSLTVEVPDRDFELSLVAEAEGAQPSTPAIIHLKFKGLTRPVPKGSLYAVVVGVGKFKDPSVPALRWPAKDARDFAAALERQEGRLYQKVDVRLLPDEVADSTSIIKALEWLDRKVGEGDVGVVFLSGHGVTDPRGNYYFVSYNAEMESAAGVTLPTRTTSVPDTEIGHALAQLIGNALFFFDTCEAGQAAMGGGINYNKLINTIAGSANAVVLASSTRSETSKEIDALQHGAFTQALLEGLAGAADYDRKGIVTIDGLNLYVKNRVTELTGGVQHPVDLKPRATSNFAFAVP
jgi:WD40 repeat protein